VASNPATTTREGPDPQAPLAELAAALESGPEGLSSEEAQRRLQRYGPNELRREQKASYWRELGRQLVHPLALDCACTRHSPRRSRKYEA